MVPESHRHVPSPSALFVHIRGRVQGVGFRYSAVYEARRLGLSGWIRNTQDGDVEVWTEGTPEKQELFLKWLRRG
ncbi:MAG: acylphosphatase, partial [Treponema sp.]|nr:acylphosphatase [Treponema sp.]